MWQNKKMYPLPDHSLLFRSSPYPYLVMAIDLTIIDANDACLRSVQRTREEIVGLHVFEAFPPDPSDPDLTNIREVKASLETAIATRKPHTTPFLRYSVPVETAAGVKFVERFWNAVHNPGPARRWQRCVRLPERHRCNGPLPLRPQIAKRIFTA